ncbi:MAG: hypothetical protein ACK5AZ_10990 [Bryobacteraceae bacterium]
MAIYTCFDMIADCRANKREGWVYFVTHYLPLCGTLIEHYYPDRSADAELLGRVLRALRDPKSSLFGTPESEREFCSRLRQFVLAAVEDDKASTAPEISLDFETLTEALAPLTAMERQAVWLEAMGYHPEHAGSLLNMDAATAGGIREKAADLLRGKMDQWNINVMQQNGFLLRQAVKGLETEQCFPSRTFLDLLDGRMTWADRQDVDRHMVGCWYCVDHLCRMREIDAILRDSRPLRAGEAEPYLKLLGLPAGKVPFWKRLFAGA